MEIKSKYPPDAKSTKAPSKIILFKIDAITYDINQIVIKTFDNLDCLRDYGVREIFGGCISKS